MNFSVEKEIDGLGRIVVPKAMREYYGMQLKSRVILVATEDGILIKLSESEQEKEDNRKGDLQ